MLGDASTTKEKRHAHPTQQIQTGFDRDDVGRRVCSGCGDRVLARDGGAPRFELRQELSADRLAEGDRLLVTVTVVAIDPLPAIEILAAVPPLLEVEAGNNRVVLGVAAGAEASWSFQLLCPARGRFELGEFYLRLWDRSGLIVRETRQTISQPVSVYPYLAPLRLVPQPRRTQFSFGNYVAARLGEGIEPGEVRPFAPGDRIRHVNWRASLRHQQLFVTQHHEERNADIVLLLDTLSETGAPPVVRPLRLSETPGIALVTVFEAELPDTPLTVYWSAHPGASTSVASFSSRCASTRKRAVYISPPRAVDAWQMAQSRSVWQLTQALRLRCASQA